MYLQLENVEKYYGENENRVMLGPSGSGKSTLLNLIGGIEIIDYGNVIVGGIDLASLSKTKLGLYRRDTLGFVFQFYHLVPNLTVKENIETGAYLSKTPLAVETLLDKLGLKEHCNRYPNQLSGGQQQRTAIGRALAKNPKLLLCDEPTGALDYQTGKAILKLLQDTCKKGMTVVVITHNQAIAPMANRIIKIKNGKVSDMTINENPLPVEKIEW